MSTIPQQRHRVQNLRLSEISSVDRPAQAGAVAVLMKRADEDTYATIRKSAAAVAEGSKPSCSVEQYEDAMFSRAAELAQHHRTTPEQALAKGLSDDLELRDLANAAEVARHEAYTTEVRKSAGGA
jgi:hypothetical protein